MPPLRVVKLGGSLLLYEGLAAATRAWLARQAPAASLLIAGGGALVDAIRAADERHRLAPADSHELAMACLSVTARLLATLLPESPLIVDPAELAAWRRAARGTAIFDLGAVWLADAWRDDGRGDGACREALRSLPRDWNTTSDSLAAAVTRRLEAGELALLKSSDPPAVASLAALAKLGFVDPCFPHAADALAVRCVNLREANFIERRWGGADEGLPRRGD